MYRSPQTSKIIQHIIDQYGAKPEYLWPEKSPTFCVFRHHDNRKWFGIVMAIPATKLGLGSKLGPESKLGLSSTPSKFSSESGRAISGQELNIELDSIIEIINLKFDQGQALDFAETSPGIFPAYHMNKRNWITLLLDDTLSDNQIFQLIAKSFRLTHGSTKTSPKRLLLDS